MTKVTANRASHTNVPGLAGTMARQSQTVVQEFMGEPPVKEPPKSKALFPGWVGKTPIGMLQDQCLKYGWEKPVFEETRTRHGTRYSSSVTLAKRRERTGQLETHTIDMASLCAPPSVHLDGQPDHGAILRQRHAQDLIVKSSAMEARHYSATLALYQTFSSHAFAPSHNILPCLQRDGEKDKEILGALPPGPREFWYALQKRELVVEGAEGTRRGSFRDENDRPLGEKENEAQRPLQLSMAMAIPATEESRVQGLEWFYRLGFNSSMCERAYFGLRAEERQGHEGEAKVIETLFKLQGFLQEQATDDMMDEVNAVELRQEEMLALASIYENMFQQFCEAHPQDSTHILIALESSNSMAQVHANVHVYIPASSRYPQARTPPMILVDLLQVAKNTATEETRENVQWRNSDRGDGTEDKTQIRIMRETMRYAYEAMEKAMGGPILYDVVEWLREHLVVMVVG